MCEKETGVFEKKDSIQEKVIKKYKYGSTVYGTATDNSDEDYVVVVEDCDVSKYNVTGDIDYTVYRKDEFIRMIKLHHITVLECIFQDEDDEFQKYFKLNTDTLRREISGVCSNSYGKCKKKMKQGDDYIGKKSLFHSLRICMFGIQIATEGKITDYSCANKYLKDILETETWEELHKKYKPLKNELVSKFRIVSPLKEEVLFD